MPIRMEGTIRRVVITGASRGIGYAVTQKFKSLGYEVIALSSGRSVQINEKLSDGLNFFDFNHVEDIERCANYLLELKPDILINNAGMNINNDFLDISNETFNAIQRVNVFAPFRLCQASLPAMKERGWGRIVNISSIWGKISMSGRAAYSASKFALDGMTVALSAEYAKYGVMANCVAPGFTATDLTRETLGIEMMEHISSQFIPLKRLATPNEVANFIVWLCSEDNSYISGQNLAIDGGVSRVR
ncbi:SDR family NAD(P)-dependent oxidoreductase [Polynucleobacter sp. Adler-ghost]|uniref:SDR family NAD(P)-dependent oxidoreductase n=1 Tax=Polynucleobacter sp. Adler-ghost TaxID=2770234 RepID=UPI001BFD91A9|nr:SDR family oxidoreductase [Polynucleobacter sp. Adler-ghost]QWE31052.1 SDR family oxidoreductase [Polynucleobacter sp. Adler-ghost]